MDDARAVFDMFDGDRACRVCRKRAKKMSLCDRCRTYRYCSIECQRADWTRDDGSGGHRSECAALVKRQQRHLSRLFAFTRRDVELALGMWCLVRGAQRNAPFGVLFVADDGNNKPHLMLHPKRAEDAEPLVADDAGTFYVCVGWTPRLRLGDRQACQCPLEGATSACCASSVVSVRTTQTHVELVRATTVKRRGKTSGVLTTRELQRCRNMTDPQLLRFIDARVLNCNTIL